MEEKNVLVAERIRFKKGIVIPGSRLYNCSRCNSAVWVAPTGVEKLKESADIIIICSDCLSLEETVNLVNIEEVEITEEQINEIERTLGYRPSKEEIMEKLREKFLKEKFPKRAIN